MHLYCPLCEKKTQVDYISHYKNQNPLFEERDLYKCLECNLIFIHPMPTQKDLDLYYKTVWTTSDEASIVYQIQANERVKYIARHISLFSGMRILDIGSGHGLLLDALKKNGFTDFTIYATDPSPENMERLKKRGIQVFPDIESIGDQQFDLVFICFVLEHIPDPVPFLSLILKHVKKRGHVFIDLPECDDTFKLFLEPHVTVYTLESLDVLAKKVGLIPIHSTGYGQRRELLIAENERLEIIKKIISVWSTIEDRIFSALSPEKAEANKRRKLYGYYKFDDEGTGRWWIRAIFKKEP